MKKQAEFLWKLLDDIDTLNDACREHDDVFRARVTEVIKKRFEVADSDGYELLWKPTPPVSKEIQEALERVALSKAEYQLAMRGRDHDEKVAASAVYGRALDHLDLVTGEAAVTRVLPVPTSTTSK